MPGPGERVIVRHVLIGTVFTLAGIVTLLIPFICIGAFIFGPIELMIGLLEPSGARERLRLLRSRPRASPWDRPPSSAHRVA